MGQPTTTEMAKGRWLLATVTPSMVVRQEGTDFSHTQPSTHFAVWIARLPPDAQPRYSGARLAWTATGDGYDSLPVDVVAKAGADVPFLWEDGDPTLRGLLATFGLRGDALRIARDALEGQRDGFVAVPLDPPAFY